MRVVPLVAILLFLAGDMLRAQPWIFAWGEAEYQMAQALEPTDDGGFFVGGTRVGRVSNQYWMEYFVTRFDALGRRLWDRSFGRGMPGQLWSMRRSSAGGVLLAGYQLDSTSDQSSLSGSASGLLFEVDQYGNEVWSMRLKRQLTDHAHFLLERRTGGYYMGGHIQSGANGPDQMWLVRYDADRNVIWERQYGRGTYEHVHSGEEAPDGGCILAGHTSFGDGSTYWIVRVDSTGEERWARVITPTDEQYGEPSRVVTTREGGFAVFGTAAHATKHFSTGWMVVLDGDGNLLIDRHYGRLTSSSTILSGRQTSDGGFILAGYGADTPGVREDIFVVKTDPAGEPEWERHIGMEQSDVGYDVMEVPDGYIVVGSTDSRSLGVSNRGFAVVAKLTRAGELAVMPDRAPIATAFPNPVAAGYVRIELPEGGTGASVPAAFPSMRIVDLRGAIVRTLDEPATGPLAPPCYSWDLRDQTGMPVPAGVYFYRTGDGALQGKIVVVPR